MQKQLDKALTDSENTASDVRQLEERLASLERAIDRKGNLAGREGI